MTAVATAAPSLLYCVYHSILYLEYQLKNEVEVLTVKAIHRISLGYDTISFSPWL